jgi:ADP-heptose:LPS heptosyltransferase
VSGTVLIYRVGQLGDTLIALPAIAEIRRRHPADRLVLLTDHHPDGLRYVSSWDVLGPTGWFDEMISYEPTHTAWRKVLTAMRLMLRLRHLKPKVVYDLAPERSAMQIRRDRAFFVGLVGVREYFGGVTLPKHGKDVNGVLPRIEPEWKRLLEIVGAANQHVPFRLAIPEAARWKAAEFFARRGIEPNQPVIAVGPGSKMPSKRWPLDRFRQLGQLLLDAYPTLQLIILGDNEDSLLGDTLVGDWGGRAHNFAGTFSIYESAAVLEQCKSYVGNDTGTMHLAAMVGTPCVALFSARDYPGQWEPYGVDHVVMRYETACAGCMLEVCTVRNNECIKLISVDEVYEVVKRRMTNECLNKEMGTGASS